MHLSVQAKGCEGCTAPPGVVGGFVITILPGKPPQIPPLSVNRRNAPPKLGSGSRGLTFLGVIDPTRISASGLRFFPNTSSRNPPESIRSSLQPFTSAGFGGVGSISGGPEESHVKVMHCRHPCSLPNAHPGGCPATGVINPRLVPPGPVTKTTNVFPIFALPKLKCASSRFASNMTKFCA